MGNRLDDLQKELNDLQTFFTDKVNELRKEYFEEGEGHKGLIVIRGNENFEVGFVIDYDSITIPSSV